MLHLLVDHPGADDDGGGDGGVSDGLLVAHGEPDELHRLGEQHVLQHVEAPLNVVCVWLAEVLRLISLGVSAHATVK